MFPGLKSYLPSEETGNRDIGGFNAGLMRFGSKHNDIFPIIGDMIRYQLIVVVHLFSYLLSLQAVMVRPAFY